MALRPETKLMNHQTKAVDYMLKHHYVLCGDEQGVGKTIEAIAVQQATGLDCLVICPATLKYNWQAEYEKFTTETPYIGTKKHKINIMNYAQLGKCEELFAKADIIIADECHYLKNMGAQRTKIFHGYIEKYRPERLLLLSGTPVKNRVIDFYSILKLLSYSPHPTNGKDITKKFRAVNQFGRYFSNERVFKMRRGRFPVEVRKFEGVRNEAELKSYFRFKYIRRLASQVLDLPEMMEKEVVVNYKSNPDLEREWQKHLKGASVDIKVKADAAAATAPFTGDYVKDLIEAGEGPVVVFTDHLAPVSIIQKKLAKKKVGTIIGETPMSLRNTYVKQFQNGELDALVCTIGAASTGLTLTASRNMVFNDESWVPSDNAQAQKRIHRIGQGKKCVIHKIIGSKAQKKITQSLKAKERDIAKVV